MSRFGASGLKYMKSLIAKITSKMERIKRLSILFFYKKISKTY